MSFYQTSKFVRLQIDGYIIECMTGGNYRTVVPNRFLLLSSSFKPYGKRLFNEFSAIPNIHIESPFIFSQILKAGLNYYFKPGCFFKIRFKISYTSANLVWLSFLKDVRSELTLGYFINSESCSPGKLWDWLLISFFLGRCVLLISFIYSLNKCKFTILLA